METIARVDDAAAQAELAGIIAVYEQDNCSAWDCAGDGGYVLRSPVAGEPELAAQDVFIQRAGRR
jgi:hypothetical protein